MRPETQPEHGNMLFVCLKAVSNQAAKLCAGSNSLFPIHGRQPNFNLLMKGSLAPGAPIPRAAGKASQDDDDSSYFSKLGKDALLYFRDPSFNIIEKPYVYLFNGRKWSHTIQSRVVWESGCVDIRHPAHREVLHCSRYEVAGTPVVIERYRFSNSAASICRMVCCPATPHVDARRGDAVHQLQGLSAQGVAEKFWTSPTSLISAVEGVSDRSWSHAFANQIGETSDSSATTTSSIVSTGGCTSSVGTPSRNEWVFGNAVGKLSSPEQQVSALALLGLCHPLIATSTAATLNPTQVHHLGLVKDMFARETKYYSDRNLVSDGWQAWRRGELSTLERFIVVNSISRIVSYFEGSRCATHLCVALLDLFVGIFARNALSNNTCMNHTRRQLKLLVMGCVLVGTKVADLFPPAVRRLASSMAEEDVEEFVINREITSAEVNVLQTLQYNVHPPTLDEVVEMILELRFQHTTKRSDNNAKDYLSTLVSDVPRNSKSDGSNMLNIGSTYKSQSSVTSFVAHLQLQLQSVVVTSRYLADLVLRDPSMSSFPVSSIGLAIVEYSILSCALQYSRGEEMWSLYTLSQWSKYMTQRNLKVYRVDTFHLEVRECSPPPLCCDEEGNETNAAAAVILFDVESFLKKLPLMSPQHSAAYEHYCKTCAERGSAEAGRVFDMVTQAHVCGKRRLDCDLENRFEKMIAGEQYSLNDTVTLFAIESPLAAAHMDPVIVEPSS